MFDGEKLHLGSENLGSIKIADALPDLSYCRVD